MKTYFQVGKMGQSRKDLEKSARSWVSFGYQHSACQSIVLGVLFHEPQHTFTLLCKSMHFFTHSANTSRELFVCGFENNE